MSARDYLFAMEDMEEEVASGDADISEAPEEELASVTEADMFENKIEDAVEDALQMEAYIEKIMSFKSNGGMSAETAELAQMQLEGFAHRNYLSKSSFPQMEAFEGTSGKHNATNMVLEGFKDTMKKWWDKIVKWMRSFAKSIVKFWQKYISFAGQLAKKAKALAAKCDNKKGDAEEKKLTLSPGQVRVLQDSSGKVVYSDIVDGLSDMKQQVVECSNDNSVKSTIRLLTTHLKSIKVNDISELKAWDPKTSGSDTHASKAAELFNKAWNYTIHTTAASGDLKQVLINPSPKNIYVADSEPFIGKQYIVGNFKADDDDNLTSIKVYMKYAGASDIKEQSIDALSVSDIQTLAKAIAVTAEAITAAKTNYQERAKLIDSIIEAGDKLNKTIAKLDGEASKEAATKAKLAKLRSAVYGLTGCASSVMEPAADVQKHAYAVASAAYNFAAKSFSNIKEKK